NFENANPGFPNDYPHLGAVVRKLLPARGNLPATVRLPHRIFNTDGSVWPGQDSGFLGRSSDLWLMNCRPVDPEFRVNDFRLSVDMTDRRLFDRQSLLERVNDRLDAAEQLGLPVGYGRLAEQAFSLLRSSASREAFELDRERDSVRDRYGRT